jgi:TPR repeat protein
LPAALGWYRAAAARNNPPALRKLGLLYDAGRGVERDPGAAFTYFSRAAAGGDEAAMRRLAAVSGAGELGQAVNPELAASWQRRADAVAAARGDAGATR